MHGSNNIEKITEYLKSPEEKLKPICKQIPVDPGLTMNRNSKQNTGQNGTKRKIVVRLKGPLM